MNTYFEQMILSASPIELIRILYQRAASSVRDAREHLGGGRIIERALSINNAYDVLNELIASLRPAEAPELAARLRALYCYMQERLLEANFKQADAPLEEVLRLLTTLADAWTVNPEPAHMPPAASNSWAVSHIESEPLARSVVMA
jgi:flagellar secretion chaperone FliS